MDTSNYESAFIAMFTKLVKSKDGRYTNFYIYHIVDGDFGGVDFCGQDGYCSCQAKL